MQVILNETILTFIFVSVVLMVKGQRTSPSADRITAIISIALTLLMCVRTGSKLGASLNPAVSFTLTMN